MGVPDRIGGGRTNDPIPGGSTSSKLVFVGDDRAADEVAEREAGVNLLLWLVELGVGGKSENDGDLV